VLKKKSFVANVYSKCDIHSKKHLWANLIMSKRNFGECNWWLAEDFNTTSGVEDMRGV
jgi:hypothetical protein